jgi:hypothetical protein
MMSPKIAALAHSDPGRMTGRARAYLAIVATRGLLVGVACLGNRRWFTSSSFDQLRGMLPGGFIGWGVFFLLAGGICALAAIARSEAAAYTGLILSAASAAAWTCGFLAAWMHGNLAGPTGVVAWASIAASDLVVCRMPLRTPFEGFVTAITRRA